MKYSLVLGLFLITVILPFSACSAPGGGTTAPATTTVQVNEFDYKIVSSLVTFTAGKPYHFEVKNNGNKTHEFMIMPKSAAKMRGMLMQEMDNIALAKVENISPGKMATLDFTFPSSSTKLRLEFVCYYPGHYEAGMKQNIRVIS